MTGLQEAFYIVALVFMGLMLVLFVALVAAVLVIRARVNRIHDMVESKIEAVTGIAEKGGELSALAGSVIAKKAKRAIRNAKK